MVKGGGDGKKKVANRNIYARLSFLQQAAQLLSRSQENAPQTTHHDVGNVNSNRQPDHVRDIPNAQDAAFVARGNAVVRELSAHTLAISKKSVIRLSTDIKRTICKRCASSLVEGQTCTSTIENKSKGGKKSRADVFVITCMSCQAQKRFPVGQPKSSKIERHKKRDARGVKTMTNVVMTEKAND